VTWHIYGLAAHIDNSASTCTWPPWGLPHLRRTFGEGKLLVHFHCSGALFNAQFVTLVERATIVSMLLLSGQNWNSGKDILHLTFRFFVTQRAIFLHNWLAILVSADKSGTTRDGHVQKEKLMSHQVQRAISVLLSGRVTGYHEKLLHSLESHWDSGYDVQDTTEACRTSVASKSGAAGLAVESLSAMYKHGGNFTASQNLQKLFV
jgi:hypothetical protein